MQPTCRGDIYFADDKKEVVRLFILSSTECQPQHQISICIEGEGVTFPFIFLIPILKQIVSAKYGRFSPNSTHCMSQ